MLLSEPGSSRNCKKPCTRFSRTGRPLEIINPSAIANGWRYVPISKAKERGAQIDLLFDREDDTLTLCEIKYTTEPFAITKEYAENLKNKIAIFKEKTRSKKKIFLVMISANGIKETKYSEELVQHVVTLEDLFK